MWPGFDNSPPVDERDGGKCPVSVCPPNAISLILLLWCCCSWVYCAMTMMGSWIRAPLSLSLMEGLKAGTVFLCLCVCVLEPLDLNNGHTGEEGRSWSTVERLCLSQRLLMYYNIQLVGVEILQRLCASQNVHYQRLHCSCIATNISCTDTVILSV